MNMAHQWLDVQGHDARQMLFNTSTPHRFILCPTFKSEVAAGTNRQKLAKNSMVHAICVSTPLRVAISKTVGGIYYVSTEKYREEEILQALQVKHTVNRMDCTVVVSCCFCLQEMEKCHIRNSKLRSKRSN